MAKLSGIYVITNAVNGKQYIGRSVDIRARWHMHKSDLRKGKRAYFPLYRAMAKYGFDAFIFEVIIFAPPCDLPNLELQFIRERNTFSPNGYNVGGTHGGFPDRWTISQMPEIEQKRRLEMNARSAFIGGAASGAALNSRPDREAYLSARSAAREATIAARRAIDPEYDAVMRAKRSSATKNRAEGYQHKSATAFKERMRSDPEFAAAVRLNRQRAQKASIASKMERLRAQVS